MIALGDAALDPSVDLGFQPTDTAFTQLHATREFTFPFKADQMGAAERHAALKRFKRYEILGHAMHPYDVMHAVNAMLPWNIRPTVPRFSVQM